MGKLQLFNFSITGNDGERVNFDILKSYSVLQLFIGNFGFNVQDEDLHDFFTPFGEVVSAEVMLDQFTGRSKGCGFVVMKELKAARKAIAALNKSFIERNIITVTEAMNVPEYSL